MNELGYNPPGKRRESDFLTWDKKNPEIKIHPLSGQVAGAGFTFEQPTDAQVYDSRLSITGSFELKPHDKFSEFVLELDRVCQLSKLKHAMMSRIAFLDVKYALDFEDLEEKMKRLIKQMEA